MDVAVEISLERLAVIRNLVQRLTFSTPLSVKSLENHNLMQVQKNYTSVVIYVKCVH